MKQSDEQESFVAPCAHKGKMSHVDRKVVKIIEHRTRAETLHWIADTLKARIAAEKQDWVNVLLRSSTRSRLKAFAEVVAMCRAEAVRKTSGANDVQEEKDKSR